MSFTFKLHLGFPGGQPFTLLKKRRCARYNCFWYAPYFFLNQCICFLKKSNPIKRETQFSKVNYTQVNYY